MQKLKWVKKMLSRFSDLKYLDVEIEMVQKKHALERSICENNHCE